MKSDSKDHNSDSDSDGPPEEFTQEQAKVEDAALRKIQRENKARVAREKKESRRRLAEKITPKKSRKIETFQEEEAEEEEEEEENPEALANKGFLPKNIIDFLAQQDKQKKGSDSKEEEETNKQHPRKKKLKSSGIETVLYKEIPPPECLKTGLEFLKKRKAQVPRSSSILKNSSQALRLITGAASAKKQRQKK
ncbi:UDP-N-acetylmuramoyl-L-alanyl-D-glutamate-2 [Hirschfeldia incana]|nr:UDP-N-acetylmuramoyl-L-alanyl-D-glutamate-2 [Hirschfeldia incana]